MSDIYELLSNEYVKSIIFNYVTNSYEYKEYLIRKYLLEFFRTCILEDDYFILVNYIDEILSNVRWYISESYLEDIKILNGKVDIYKFWSRLQRYWYESVFNISWVLENLDKIHLKFVLSDSTRTVEACFVYQGYRLSISHKYIESNFFGLRTYSLQYKYIPSLRFVIPDYSHTLTIGEVYNSILVLYKDYPEKYTIKNRFLILNYRN